LGIWLTLFWIIGIFKGGTHYMNNEALQLAAKDLGLTTDKSFDRQLLVDQINKMLQHDFEKLVSTLYRIDVDETKLRLLLDRNTGQDSAEIITDLVIERQVQKIKSREQFRGTNENISDDDKW
jgi:hypothetical protein